MALLSHHFVLTTSPSPLSLSLSFSGFGLPHTDENFYNANLENCLDYTSRPESNVEPGQVNFDKLEDAYLNVEEELERMLLRGGGRVEDNIKDGIVTETIGVSVIHEDKLGA